MTTATGPLQGVKVVSCSTAQAGTVPYTLMADLGAEVIKIETPGRGDPSRTAGQVEGYPSSYFETNNRGVKSLTLNLKDPRALDILYKLVAEADIFGQNFRPGAAERNGFGYEGLKKINPKLVYASISGYGPDGPHAALPGTDAMGQALGGLAEAFSEPGRPLLGGQLRLLGWTLTTTMWRGSNPVTGQARMVGTEKRPGMSVCFEDRDGKPFVFQLSGPKWQVAMQALGFHEELEAIGLGDLGPAVVSEDKRNEMLATLDACFARDSRDRWVETLRAADIVAAPINTLLEAVEDPDVLANGYISEIEYPEHDKTAKVHGTPWKFSETPAQIGTAPKLGEHNAELLGQLGYSYKDIEALTADGVI